MVSYFCFREEETEAQGGWIQEDMAGLRLNQSVGSARYPFLAGMVC